MLSRDVTFTPGDADALIDLPVHASSRVRNAPSRPFKPEEREALAWHLFNRSVHFFARESCLQQAMESQTRQYSLLDEVVVWLLLMVGVSIIAAVSVIAVAVFSD